MPKLKIILHLTDCHTSVEAVVKKTFRYLNQDFAVHRPYYKFLNNGEGGFSDSSWTVSELSTGASLGYLQDSRGASPPTIAIAMERAIEKLSHFNAKKIHDLITQVKEKINARNVSSAA
jgi:hypothetical protein